MSIPAPLLEALKEGLRVVVLAIIPIIIAQVESGMWDMRAVLIVGALALLRFADKWLHEIGKEREDGRMIRGLTRF